METRIEPIEKPSSLLIKIAYQVTKLLFGKVLTPVKVIYSRLPFGFLMFSNRISSLDKKLSLPKDLSLMIKIHVAQINMCTFCIDIAKVIAIQKQVNTEKFYELNEFRESALYTDAEKAALQFAEELTLHKKVSDDTFSKAQQYFSERQLIEIAWLVATEHYYNLLNIAFDIHSDNLCDINKAKNKKPQLV